MTQCDKCGGSGVIETRSREWGIDVETCPECADVDSEPDEWDDLDEE